MISKNLITLFALCMLVLFVQVRVTSSKPTKYVPKSPEEKYLIRLFDYYRKVIIHGSRQFGIEVLDPLKIEELHQVKNDNEKDHQINSHFKNIVIVGLGQFEVTKLEAVAKLNSFKVNLYLKTLTMTGDYDMNNRFAILGGIRVFGKGKFRSWLSSASVSGVGTLSETGGKLTVSKMEFDLKIKDYGINFENLNGGGLKGKLMNSAINHFGKTVFTASKGEMLKNMAEDFMTNSNLELESNGITSIDKLMKHLDEIENTYNKPN